MNLPIIKFEIEGMRHTLAVMLAEHNFNMDQYVQEAITAFCTEENLRAIITKRVSESIEQAVAEETRHYFLYGEGRKAIKEAVVKKLEADNASYG